VRRPAVSIIVLTHDAPRHCARVLRTLRRTRGVAFEVVVVDNASRLPTRLLLRAARLAGWIDRLRLLSANRLFAEGNNIGAREGDPAGTHLLLLNSDVRICHPDWLARMLRTHRRGATSLGYVGAAPWPRGDGYCLLIDRDLYLEAGGLDEDYAWWWGAARLQARLLAAGHSVRAVPEFRHAHLVRHAWHGSGEAFAGAKGMDTDWDTVVGWFAGRRPEVVLDI
jgi:GT2 family glycosyltransferase